MSDHNNAAIIKPFNAADYQVAVVWCQFNSHLTTKMRDAVTETLMSQYQIPPEQITVISVAGAADLPPILSALGKSKKYDCIIPLGVIIRGDTDHYQFVADIATRSITDVAIKEVVSVPFGVLTVENEVQAVERVDHAQSYAHAGMHNARLLRTLS